MVLLTTWCYRPAAPTFANWQRCIVVLTNRRTPSGTGWAGGRGACRIEAQPKITFVTFPPVLHLSSHDKGEGGYNFTLALPFAGLSGDQFQFDRNGDGPARYNIIHFKQVQPGRWSWVRVGEYSGSELHLNMSGECGGTLLRRRELGSWGTKRGEGDRRALVRPFNLWLGLGL